MPFASICFAEPETERGAAQDGVEVAEDVCTPDPCCCWLHHGVLLLLVEMRRCFVLAYYSHDLHLRLKRLVQGDRSVDEYF